MLDRVLAIFAYIVLCLFVGVLVFKLQRLDISIVAAIAILLAGWDMLGRKKS
ncbi:MULTISPECIES: hypothetical protein [unclassified Yoonia]|uniref:hypothetical protein n=1 Tax=unclassified Yoonia TaxID=2629118 RepID=UPI002AFE1B15|nr:MULTISPECIES: hypothetical protein [unclassified Yoonia]